MVASAGHATCYIADVEGGRKCLRLHGRKFYFFCPYIVAYLDICYGGSRPLWEISPVENFRPQTKLSSSGP